MQAQAIAAHGGVSGLLKTEVWLRTLKFIVLSPLIGMVLGFTLMVIVYWIFRRSPHRESTRSSGAVSFCPQRLSRWAMAGTTRRRRWASSPRCSQRVVFGVCVWTRRNVAGNSDLRLSSPRMQRSRWARLSGGWRIVRTMGTRITKLKPVGGFCAESAAALTLAYVTLTGTPVSTTHTITGSIVGVGATRRLSAVKWGVAGRIVWAWILTIPAAASSPPSRSGSSRPFTASRVEPLTSTLLQTPPHTTTISS